MYLCAGGAAAGRDHAADVDRLRARLSLVQMLRIHGPYPSLEHNKVLCCGLSASTDFNEVAFRIRKRAISQTT
jgi:hypothetical protein